MTLETLTEGYVWVDGKPLWHMRARLPSWSRSQKYLREMRKQIGMVFQHFNLFPNMSVLENVIELRFAPWARAETRRSPGPRSC